MAVIVVDASMMIGFLDAKDPHHRRAVATLTAMGGESLVVPASAYAEIVVTAHARHAAIRNADECFAKARVVARAQGAPMLERRASSKDARVAAVPRPSR